MKPTKQDVEAARGWLKGQYIERPLDYFGQKGSIRIRLRSDEHMAESLAAAFAKHRREWGKKVHKATQDSSVSVVGGVAFEPWTYDDIVRELEDD